jgi:hypothetical protein
VGAAGSVVQIIKAARMIDNNARREAGRVVESIGTSP